MIDQFTGEYRWLSNFWPYMVHLDGVLYPTVEHAYQAAKTLNADQRIIFEQLRTPGDAKRLGKQLRLRDDWEQVKLDTMERLLREKFSLTNALSKLLLATGSQELVEGNWWGDRFWGVCGGVGENHLGKLLIKIREELAK